MKIGIVCPVYKPITQLTPGGLEVFCNTLAKGLIQKGHRVFLFASSDSHVEGVTLIPTAHQSILSLKKNGNIDLITSILNRDPSITSLNNRTILFALKNESKLDIIHDNTFNTDMSFFSDIFRVPIITTIHIPIDTFITQQKIQSQFSKRNNTYVAISDYQRSLLPSIPYVIKNGVNLDDFSYADTAPNSIIWLGRIDKTTKKGLEESLLIANQLQIKLDFVGYIEHEDYFLKEIKPLIKSNTQYRSPFLSLKQKSLFLSSGKAMLSPIGWEEPFGLTIIEAMACGTPIIGYAKGAYPEIIEDGKTGYLVNSSHDDIRGNFITNKTGIEGLKEAIKRMYSLTPNEYTNMRLRCRKLVEAKYSSQLMANNYIDLYKKVLSGAV